MEANDSESSPLLSRQPSKTGSGQRLRHFLYQKIDLRRAYIALLVCSFVTGLIDAGAFQAWGVFMGMHTGNTIIFALGVTGGPGGKHFAWDRSLLAITSFMLGSMLSAHITRYFGATRRLTLIIWFLLQGLSVMVAGILVTVGIVPRTGESDDILIGIPFLAWQFGASVAASRALGYNEIPTSVLTSLYNDLASDPKLLKWNNPQRNRRVYSAFMIIAGGICGGYMLRVGHGFEVVLWLAAAIKISLGVFWLLLAGEPES